MAHHRAEKRAATQRPRLEATGEPGGGSKTPSGQRSSRPAGQHRAAVGPAAEDAAQPDRPASLPRVRRGRATAGLITLAVAAVVAAQAIDVDDANSTARLAASADAGSLSTTISSTISSGATPVTTTTTTTGMRDRRERAVSRDAHREAQASAADRRLRAVTEKAAKRRTAALAQLAAEARHQAAVIAENTWQLPVTSGAYHLTSGFGECSSLWSHCHTGLDFAAPDGTPVHAVTAGTVKSVGYAGAYGNQTIITTRDGTDLWYCHQSATAVQPGDKVSAGQTIGAVGSTGNTTGPHLHLEVRPRPDHPVDPFAALVSHGIHP